MKKNMLLACSALLLFSALFAFPKEMMDTSQTMLQMCLTTVIPSLFPFLAAVGLLLPQAQKTAAARFSPFMRYFFRSRGICALPLFLGFLSGYPMGAKVTETLYEKRLLTAQESRYLMTFVNLPSPLFVLGTVGTGFFGTPLWGYALLGAIWVSALAEGLIMRPFFTLPSSMQATEQAPTLPAASLSRTMEESVLVSLRISAFIIFFSLLQKGIFLWGSAFLSPAVFQQNTVFSALFGGLMEMTGGTAQLPQTTLSLRLQLSLAAGLLAFGGLSVAGQVKSVTATLPLPLWHYFLAKGLHGIFASGIMYLIFPIFSVQTEKALPAFFQITGNASMYPFCICSVGLISFVLTLWVLRQA